MLSGLKYSEGALGSPALLLTGLLQDLIRIFVNFFVVEHLCECVNDMRNVLKPVKSDD